MFRVTLDYGRLLINAHLTHSCARDTPSLSTVQYNMASDSPSARIGVLVEFNYEDLEVLYLFFQGGEARSMVPSPSPSLDPSFPSTRTYRCGTHCYGSGRKGWKHSLLAQRQGRCTNPRRATPARQTETLTALAHRYKFCQKWFLLKYMPLAFLGMKVTRNCFFL